MSDEMDVDSPRGTKRKADEVEADPTKPRRIQALDPDVVNKIAAGEIIVAPVHALKELIENAVDAGSTSLEVLVKDGGLKLLQITDNGCGIEKEDLAILCERFTTSKLQKFEDLSSIATYGFRGEALASISHIAHLSVTTKTKDSNCAWRAHYGSGKLVAAKPGQAADPKPVAGRPGTQITVEDLFYNVPTRKRAFRSPSEEYNKIMDMVGRYAIHCSHVAFSCKKHGESSTSIAIQSSAATTDRIRQIYGGNVANELVEYETADDRWGFKAHGWATNANYHSKKTTLLLFINHRCVESTNIRKTVEQTYAGFLPKNGRPFVYLSLEIDPQRVDVNVHPTKKEVNFLNEDEIVQAICEELRSKLADVDKSRTFMTQTLLLGGAMSGTTSTIHKYNPDGEPPASASSTNAKRTAASTRPYENNLVRTDTNMRKITSMLAPTSAGADTSNGDSQAAEPIEYETTPDREPSVCRLTSVKELRAAVRDDMHHELTDILANHTFVGVVDERRRLAAIQGGVRLFLIDYGRFCYEYFYQVGLTDFGNFGVIKFTPALDLRGVLAIAAEREMAAMSSEDAAGLSVEDMVDAVLEQLVERREMLLEYFSLEISPAGELISIPLLVKGYQPSMAKLPRFLLRLGPRVDWTEEQACFDTFLKELATFYVPEQLPPAAVPTTEDESGEGQAAEAPEEDPEIKARRAHVRWAVEHILFPAFKARLVATKTLMKGGVLEIASLKGLYRKMASYGGYSKPAYGAHGGEDGGGFMSGSQQGSQGQGGKNYAEESLRPVTIKQLNACDESTTSQGAEFVSDGHPLTQVTLVGQVREVNRQQTNVTYRVDDGTGVVDVKKWIDSDAPEGADATAPGVEQDQHVRVYGRLKSYNSKRNVVATLIRPVDDYNEVNYHLLEATYVHLYLTRGAPGGAANGAANGGAGGEDSMFVDGGGYGGDAGGTNAKLGLCSAAAQKMYNYLANTSGGTQGLHMQMISRGTGMSEQEVTGAAYELQDQGLVYTPEDNETWAIMEF
ncbi:uncharacterized protein E0L32_010759 [Thyridium curvatum]|uniref:DNA mismatch repair protein S5 domain-containing protein n=1 Tax=Thyridium curvatum TaxID=1093900 RepID=A0A507AK57_9PEZI|nr:uncharacterized protein E0L32_010759 [Thyridium curvatum]TPX07337.1 hypothetical protein E0L32_010759 [Thyridium curvatum]